MKFAVGDDVGQVKVITTCRGTDTSVQTSARAKISSFLEPNRKSAIQGLQVVNFHGRSGVIAVASKGGLLRILDPLVSPLAPEPEQVLFTQQIPKLSPTDEANVVALGYTNGILYACTSSGSAQFLTLPESGDVTVEAYGFAPAEGSVAAFAIHPTECLPENVSVPKAVAIAGENRELEIWESSIVEGKVCWKSVWKAKNVKHTKLGLEVPIWIQCIIFLPSVSTPSPAPPPALGKGRRNAPAASSNTYRVATGTHYSHFRLYDTSVSRRPVFSTTLSQTPILQLRLHPSTPSSPGLPLTSGKESPVTTKTLQELHFIHTDMNGHFGLYNTFTRRPLGIYKGVTGAVLSVTASKGSGGEPLVAGVGFDRYLWVYEGEEREVVSKVYVKTKGTAVVVLDSEDEKLPEKEMTKKDADEEVWDEMEVVEGEGEGGVGGEGEGDYTGALVKIKRKKGERTAGGKKRRVE